MPLPEGIGLAGFNALPDDEARRALLACCSSPAWAEQVTSARPYDDPQHLFDVADTALAGLDQDEVEQALAGHPRIGERAEGARGAWSRREQSGMAAADEATAAAIAEGNREYEQRFGHVYLVCASGRSAEELLVVLRQRLSNDPRTEQAVVREELGKINRIRLGRLLGEAEAA